MTSIELFGLNHTAIVELFELDLAPIGVNQVRRFCNYSQTNGADVQFGGLTFFACPILASSNWERNSGGTLPTPTVTISNIFNLFSELTIAFGDLRGAKVTRKTVLANHLDGAPQADPNAIEAIDIYYVSRYSQNEIVASIILSHPLDRMGLTLPRRRIVQLLQ